MNKVLKHCMYLFTSTDNDNLLWDEKHNKSLAEKKNVIDLF